MIWGEQDGESAICVACLDKRGGVENFVVQAAAVPAVLVSQVARSWIESVA